MLQCVLYIFLGGILFLSNGCIPYHGAVTIDRVEYVDSPPPTTYSYKEVRRYPVGYTLHRSKMPMRYHADEYDWHYVNGLWYKRLKRHGVYTYPGVYPYRKKNPYWKPRIKVYRPVLPKKTFIKPKRKKKKKKGPKWKK